MLAIRPVCRQKGESKERLTKLADKPMGTSRYFSFRSFDILATLSESRQKDKSEKLFKHKISKHFRHL